VTYHSRPQWEKIGSSDSGVNQSLFSLWRAWDWGDYEVEHDVKYTIDLEYFAYLRTEWIHWCDPWDSGPFAESWFRQNLTVDFYYANDSIRYRVFFQVQKNYNVSVDERATIGSLYVYEYDGGGTRSVLLNGSGATSYEDFWLPFFGKSAVWRTQENQFGVMVKDDDLAIWTYGTPAGMSSNEENESVWVSDGVLDNFDVTVTLGYRVYQTEADDRSELMMSFPYFEYDYWRASGVVQPHFSSVWWTGDSGGRWSDYTPPFYSEEDAYTNDTDNRPWWEILGGNIIGGLQGFGQAIINIGPSIVEFLTGALLAIPMLGAAVVAGVINLFVPGGGTAMFGVVFDLGAGLVSIFGIVPFLLDLFGMIIGHVTFWVNWFFTYILTAENMLWIGLFLLLIPMVILNTSGKEAAFDFVKTYYVGAVVFILVTTYKLAMAVLNLIAGFLPGT
jgi:Na+/phosphate symporter